MKYSTNAIRLVSILALALIGLLQAPSGPASARRGQVLAARAHSLSRLNHERSFSRVASWDVAQKTKARGSEAYSRLPISFEANDGQTDSKVKFFSRGGCYGLFLTQSEAVLTLRRESSSGVADTQSTMRMKLIGADPAPQVEGLDRLPGRTNYIIGRDRSPWRRDVVEFGEGREARVASRLGYEYFVQH